MLTPLRAWAGLQDGHRPPPHSTEALNLARQRRLPWGRELGSTALSPYKARPSMQAGHPALGLIRQIWRHSSAGALG